MTGDRGYLFTALTTLMLLTVFMLAYYYHYRQHSETFFEVTPYKNNAFNDNMKVNMQDILGLKVSLLRNENVTITFQDTIPSRYNLTEAVANYSTYVNQNFRTQINSNINFNATSFDRLFPIEPLGYIYGWPDDYKSEIRVYNTSTDVSALMGYEISASFEGDAIQDVIWLEAENLTSGSPSSSTEASAGLYVTLAPAEVLEGNITIPLTTNYTLWVRSADNETEDHQFRVEIDGVNSSENFGEHTDGPFTFSWQKGDRFNLTAEDSTIRVFGPSSSTAYVDVIMLGTDPSLDPDDHPPFGQPQDPLQALKSPGDMDFSLKVYFSNLNYTCLERLNSTSLSTFNFTFMDNDSLLFKVGGFDIDGFRAKSVQIGLNSTVNGSEGTITTKMSFQV